MAAVDRFVATDLAEGLAARRADALVDPAEHAIDHGDAPAVDDDRYLVTLHLEPKVVTGGAGCCTVAAGDGLADTPTSVPVTSARRILCDAAIEVLFEDPTGTPCSWVGDSGWYDVDYDGRCGCATVSAGSQAVPGEGGSMPITSSTGSTVD